MQWPRSSAGLTSGPSLDKQQNLENQEKIKTISQSLDEMSRAQRSQMSRILATSHISELARTSSAQQLHQVKDALLQTRDLHSKEISKNMKFQDIILAENRKLSRQLLSLTQLLYDQKHLAPQHC